MKPSQAPIYRSVERLLHWSITFTATLPKALPYQVYGTMLLQDTKQCLEAAAAAVTTDRDDLIMRMRYLDEIIIKISLVKSTLRVFSECRNNTTPILSHRQYGQFIELANNISTQAGAWRNKTAQVAH